MNRVSPIYVSCTLYRSSQLVLVPEPSMQRRGTFANVVFPTGIDRRDDLGQLDRFDIYYGMDDYRIGVVRLDVTPVLPTTGTANPPRHSSAREAPVGARLHDPQVVPLRSK
jgi:hypothetical protein